MSTGPRGAGLAAAAAVLWAMSATAAASAPEPLDLSPSSADFGSLVVGELSDLTITAKNVADEPLVVDEVRLDPGDAAVSVVADGCAGSRLDAGGSCTLTLRFQPVTEVFVETELIVTTDRGSAAIPVHGSAEVEGGATAAPPPESEPPTGDLAPTGTEPSAEDAPTGTEAPGGGLDPTGTERELDGAEPGEGDAEPSTNTEPGSIDPGATGDSAPPADSPSKPDITVCEERIRRERLSGSFVPEVTMTEGDTETVGLALAIDGTPLATPPGAETAPTTIVTFASDGCVVTAELVGGGFEITPDYPREQSFVTSEHLEWSWQVTPIRSGSLELQAQVTPWLVRADGTRHAGAASTYYADIAVTARPKLERSFGYRLNEMVGSPAGGTVAGVLVAGLSAGLVTLIRTRLARQPTGEDDGGQRPKS